MSSDDVTTASIQPRGPERGPSSEGSISAHDASDRRGDLIGPYKLLDVIGEGGFGVVWLAERREPMVQRVALKIIKPGMDSKAVVARFEQERQALAVMDHPNVAKVLDGGVTVGGRPYFVMEYVRGEPITTFADRHRLTIKQRLEIFIPVCDAVQHAHHKGIIHRDLKPSNILVAPGSEESTSVVKVIDFGVAKAISHTLTDKTIFTEHGQIIGTPEYMSPEQAEMGATDIDTRTDVYSLGVVLYELLSGTLPFDPKTLRGAGYAEIQRIIREVDPPRPSTKMSASDDDTGAVIAKARQSDLDKIADELRRELEWIPLKALRKDRRERYLTALDLAADIRRYLNGDALDAGPVSMAYRARKWLRRNRSAVLVAAAVTTILVVAGIIAFQFRSRAAIAETRLLAAELDPLQRRNMELSLLAQRMGIRDENATSGAAVASLITDDATRASLAKTFRTANNTLESRIAEFEAKQLPTIRESVQEILREELRIGVERADAVRGRAVVLDPYTGWLLGAVSVVREVPGLIEYPWDSKTGTQVSDNVRYRTIPDSGTFHDLVDDSNPCLADSFEPGSMLKPFVWAICTDLDVAGQRTRFDTNGGRRTTEYGRIISDTTPRDERSWAQALVDGSNMVLTQAVEALEFEELREGLGAFGFGSPPGSAFATLPVGELTTEEAWSKYTQTSVAMGHEIKSTPLQIARAFAAFAQPLAVEPRIPEVTLQMSGPLATSPIDPPVLATTAQRVRDLLVDAAALAISQDEPYNQPLQNVSPRAFGVSGTSLIPLGTPPTGKIRPNGSDGYFPAQYTAGYIVAAPVESPRIIVLVLIDDPGPDLVRSRAHYGRHAAGPVAGRILSRVLTDLEAYERSTALP